MSDRAVSEMIGYILIFGIVVIAATTVFTKVHLMVSESKENVRFESMVQGFRKIQSAVENVVYGKSQNKELRILLSGGNLGISNNNFLNVEVVVNNTTIFSDSLVMGGIEYEYEDYVMAFESGGVWLKSFGKTTIISPPRIFIYKKTVNNETIVFVAVTSLTGNGSAGGEGLVNINFALSSASINLFNESGYVELRINSRYADGWKKYFDELRGYANNTVLQTNLTGNNLNVSIYFDELVLARYNITAKIW